MKTKKYVIALAIFGGMLFTAYAANAYNSDGTTTAKTPMGCFEDKYIDNDLAFVFEQIDKYNYED